MILRSFVGPYSVENTLLLLQLGYFKVILFK